MGIKDWKPKDCIIHQLFLNSNDPEYYQEEYCFKNCRFKCLKNQEYKKLTKETLTPH